MARFGKEGAGLSVSTGFVVSLFVLLCVVAGHSTRKLTGWQVFLAMDWSGAFFSLMALGMGLSILLLVVEA